jgi:hypothetical protein
MRPITRERAELTIEQGFDEFMNLVVDDAVEVQLATKDAPAKRRQLGILDHHLPCSRTDPWQGRSFSKATMFR